MKEMIQLINKPEKAPHIFSNDLSMHLVHLQSLPGRFSGTGQVGNTRNIGSPYMDKGRLL
jgi:hypothetical protein